jgi:hypothetical protein
MSEELPHLSAVPEDHQRRVRDRATQVFSQAAAEATAPGGRARSLWRRRVEPGLVALAALAFVAWALARVFLSR